MSTQLENRVSKFLHCDVRCQLLVHGQRVVHMFDTTLRSVTPLDDGGFLVAYDGGAMHLTGAEIVEHPVMLILRAKDNSWSLVVTRWADMPRDLERFPTQAAQR